MSRWSNFIRSSRQRKKVILKFYTMLHQVILNLPQCFNFPDCRRLVVSRRYLRYRKVGEIEVDGNCCVKVFTRPYYGGVSQLFTPGLRAPLNYDRIGSMRIEDCQNLRDWKCPTNTVPPIRDLWVPPIWHFNLLRKRNKVLPVTGPVQFLWTIFPHYH